MNQRKECIPVFHVIRAIDNRWQVVGDALDQPSPLFDAPQDACDWAIARANLMRGRVLVENTPVDIEPGKTISCRLHGTSRQHDSLRDCNQWLASAAHGFPKQFFN
jgi:hypothetical protein